MELQRDHARRGYAPEELAVTYGIGRTTVFAEIKAGRLKAKKVGRRTIILHDDAERWASALEDRAVSDAA